MRGGPGRRIGVGPKGPPLDEGQRARDGDGLAARGAQEVATRCPPAPVLGGCTPPGALWPGRARVLELGQQLGLAYEGLEHLLLRRLGGAQLADEAALVHHVDAVAHAEQLLHFGRDHNDRPPLRGECRDELIDLFLGADVDATRWLIDDDDGRVSHHHLGQQQFLLMVSTLQLSSVQDLLSTRASQRMFTSRETL